MGTISVSLPSDGQTIDAADYNVPINTIVSVINGGLDSDNIAASGVVPNNLQTGTGTSWGWTTYTPSLAGVTIGNGTITGRYKQVGKTVQFTATLLLGGTTSITGSIQIGLPAVAPAATSNIFFLCPCYGLDAATKNYAGVGVIDPASSTTLVSFMTSNDSANSWNATTPFAWGSADKIYISGQYEAA